MYMGKLRQGAIKELILSTVRVTKHEAVVQM